MSIPSHSRVKPAKRGDIRDLYPTIAKRGQLLATGRFLPFCLVLFAIILFAGVRYRLRAMPLERD